MDFYVGTFNRKLIFSLRFIPPSPSKTPATLSIQKPYPALGPHGWLALSPSKQTLYGTIFAEPSGIASYSVDASSGVLSFLNSVPVASRSAYACASSTHLYSAGGPSGDVFALRKDGGIDTKQVQSFSVVTAEEQQRKNSQHAKVQHGSFGGVRHGTHSCDLSIDGRHLFIADIGRNCIWTYAVGREAAAANAEHCELICKTPAPGPGDDGPRHAWPHPNGRVLYVLQEHSSMIDAYEIVENGNDAGLELRLMHPRVRCIPKDKSASDFWADEVRTSSLDDDQGPPRYLYASTRGLDKATLGYVAVWELDKDGRIKNEQPADMYQTRTSGGWANAIQPAPRFEGDNGVEYIALTDSEEGWVSVLSFDGTKIREAAAVNLSDDQGIIGAATAIWI